MNKINFTPEHKAKLEALSLEALLGGRLFKGKVGTEYTIYDLFHNCGLNTITDLNISVKKQLADLENMDEFSMNSYQITKKGELEKTRELLTLIGGFKRKQEEVAKNKEIKKALNEQLTKLKEDKKTPDEKIQELEAQLATITEN